MASASSFAIVPLDARAPKRAKLSSGSADAIRQAVVHSSQTKTALVNTLTTLRDAGELEGFDGVNLRNAVAQSVTEHVNVDTPYGKVIQTVHLDAPKLKYLDVCSPLALLYYLGMLSVTFAEIMHDLCRSGRPLRLIIYADEMCPGNPFRPEKSRTLQCVYWCFADWPDFMLTRTFAWPVLTLIRSTVVSSIAGGMAYVCRLLLRLFFPENGHSLSGSGVPMSVRGFTFTVTAVFAWFLCDLKGYKENLGWKGTTGTLCCLNCVNVAKKKNVRGDVGRVVGLDCADRTKFIARSNDDIYNNVDELAAEHPRMSTTNFEKLETQCGFNHVPNGILMDMSLRNIFRPADHTLRDYMHVLVGDGVANTLIAETLHVMIRKGFTLPFVRRFMCQCKLPSKYGRVHEDWLRDSRLKNNTLASFSSIVITLIPIIYMFLQEFCAAREDMVDVVECFQLLHWICGLMKVGPSRSMQHVNKLEELIQAYHAAFGRLFRSFKPKIHHLHHVIDSMRWVGKLLSCFVTERKHRSVKDAALHVFRHRTHSAR